MDLPAKHVETTLQSTEPWTHKVLLADRSALSKEWVKALKELLKGLAAFVKQHHAAGPEWNPGGIPLSRYRPGAPPSSGKCSGHPLELMYRWTICPGTMNAVYSCEVLHLAQSALPCC